MYRLNFVAVTTFLLAVVSLAVNCLAQESATQTQSPTSRPLSSVEVDQLKAKAEAGDVTAELGLGKAYEDGKGVPQSDQEAARWFRAAAEQGNAGAQNNLGVMYSLGSGVDKDKAEAVRWYKKAAKQESPNAMFNLGAAYYNGDGVAGNILTAYAWFLLAQSFHNQSGIDAVGNMKKETGSLEPDALEEVGDMYEKGDDLPQNSNEAISWYRRAAGNGSAGVQMKLANLLFRDQNAAANYAEIHGLCEGAASRNSPQGDYCMGQLYDHGWGVEQDFAKAAKWFIGAAGMGLATADLRLGEMYWKGEGVKQDRFPPTPSSFWPLQRTCRGRSRRKKTWKRNCLRKNCRRGNPRRWNGTVSTAPSHCTSFRQRTDALLFMERRFTECLLSTAVTLKVPRPARLLKKHGDSHQLQHSQSQAAQGPHHHDGSRYRADRNHGRLSDGAAGGAAKSV